MAAPADYEDQALKLIEKAKNALTIEWEKVGLSNN